MPRLTSFRSKSCLKFLFRRSFYKKAKYMAMLHYNASTISIPGAYTTLFLSLHLFPLRRSFLSFMKSTTARTVRRHTAVTIKMLPASWGKEYTSNINKFANIKKRRVLTQYGNGQTDGWTEREREREREKAIAWINKTCVQNLSVRQYI